MGYFLVAHQFLFIVLVVVSGPLYPMSWIGIILGLGALIFALWALWTMGRYLRVAPAPAKNGKLLQTGPYGIVRHPMYSSLIVMGGVLAFEQPSAIRWCCYVALCIVLYLKSDYEESLLVARFDGYENYKKKVKKLVPYIF